MKNIISKVMVLSLSAMFVLPVVSFAEYEGSHPKKVKERVDANHDGVVTEEEKVAHREKKQEKLNAFIEKHPEFIEKHDADGDGVLSEEERKAAHAAIKEKKAEKRKKHLENHSKEKVKNIQ